MARAKRILFVEDDPSGREVGVFNLRKAGYEVDACDSGTAALETFDEDRHDVVVTDVKMPGISGMEILRAVKARSPGTPVLVVTAYGNVELAVEAMKAGAFDFIGKPFNRDHLLLAIGKALEDVRLRAEVETLRIRATGVERDIVFRSDAMGRVLEMADRVANSDASVLIVGESGTGKELIARRVHVRSRRPHGPFVAINCAAVPPELLESELFGHERGAFTGAVRARAGRFRQADGGTLFLDEVVELPLPLQSKLLRVLQELLVDVVGSDTPVRVDVRVIAATNQVVAEQVRAGRLREDLLYRLNVVELRIPPLRSRTEDIEPLVRHFVARFAGERELAVPDELIAALKARPWPGNVRELENACERLVILCSGDQLRVADLPPPPDGVPAPSAERLLDDFPPLPDDGLSLVDLEKRVIERVLRRKDGNVTQAAAYLRIPRHVLAYRMEKYGIRRHGDG